MIGWMIIGLFLVGVALFVWSLLSEGYSADDRMASAFMQGLGIVLIGIAVLIALGAGLWNLF